ncbi:MAG: hypothetical protein KAS99_02155 [Candidatus Omnitrophica bacterium]|nr:hypothetical protein [Candidatus Omnitrophota bacterium]
MLKNLAWRLFSKIIIVLYDFKIKSPASGKLELVEDLRKEFQNILPKEMKNCSLVEKEWEENMNRLRELILTKNPREFLRWDVIRKTMSVDHAPYIRTELNHLKGRHDWNELWRDAIKKDVTGSPMPFPLYPRSSGNVIHHAYHLCQFEEKTKIRGEKTNFIFEFGGGYGGMCKLIHNLGFKGKYLIFDLPPFFFLQKFFLRSSGIPVHTIDTFMRADSGVVCVSDIEELDIILDNHRDEKQSLFIATWSISEVPVSLRKMILPLISRFSSYLIAFQDRFGKVNNNEFFENWQRNYNNDLLWFGWKIGHLPGHNYLIGTRFISE